jgi:hypothetical protein
MLQLPELAVRSEVPITLLFYELEPAASVIGCFSQTHEHIDDSGIFAGTRVEKQSVLGKADDGSYGPALSCGCWTDDRYRPQLGIQEYRRFGHDQVGLERIGGSGTLHSSIRIDPAVEVGEGQIAIRDVGCVAGLVVPGLEVHDFAAADAEQHAQDFDVSDFLSQRGVQTAAALLDECKVEARGIGNGLEVVGNVTAAVHTEVAIA